VTLAGQVTAKLFASTTGSDGDWIVKLMTFIRKNISRIGSYPDTN